MQKFGLISPDTNVPVWMGDDDEGPQGLANQSPSDRNTSV